MFKIFQSLLVVVTFWSSQIMATPAFEKMDIKIIDPSKATFNITVHPTVPKSVDVDVHSFLEAKDISLRIGAFSLIDGKYNEVIETETFSLCDMSKSENLLIGFVYKEMQKFGNLTTSPCPLHPGYYHLKGFTIHENAVRDANDLPIALPPGSFKIELNGTLHDTDGKDHPVFITDVYFKEI